MANIDITDQGSTLNNGVLQLENGVAMDTTLRYVADQLNTKSQLLLATNATTVEGTLKIKTANVEYLDVEDTLGNNRFTISKAVGSQKVDLDFASNPTSPTDIVGGIRTFQDGVNLSDSLFFRKNGQATFTERVNVEGDSSVTTQTSSVIASTTTNANLVIAPNGTGALIADIPDGTATGGNARGTNAVDLQMSRTAATNIASGQNATISGGSTNTASSNFSTVSGGQSNTASSGIHATVVGGQSNTSSGNHSVSGGNGNTASGNNAIAFGLSSIASARNSVSFMQSNVSATESASFGYQNTVQSELSAAYGHNNTINASGGIRNFTFGNSNSVTGTGVSNAVAIGNGSSARASNSISLGDNSWTTSQYSITTGIQSLTYLYGQTSNASGAISFNRGDAQQSLLTARRQATLSTGATTTLSLDGTGTTNLIIPDGSNRMWNVQVRWVAVVTGITGTATGVTVGDTKTSTDLLTVAKRSGSTTVSAHTSAGTHVIETVAGSLTAANIAYSAGASQEMAITFTGPTFAGGGSVTMRVVAAISLTEVAY